MPVNNTNTATEILSTFIMVLPTRVLKNSSELQGEICFVACVHADLQGLLVWSKADWLLAKNKN